MRAAALSRASGLTLIEVICALAIGAMLMATLMGTLTLTARAMTEAGQSARQRRIEAGIERILRHDLTAAVLPDAQNVVAFTGGPTAPSDVSEEPCMEFLTTAHLSRDTSAGGAEITDVSYVLRTDSDAAGKLVLLRREAEYAPGKPPPERPLERLATGIIFWQLSFYDGARWLPSWRRNMPPVAVKLELSFEGDERQAVIGMAFAPVATADVNPTDYANPPKP
ncbi:MAG: type II secretion system protein GspJ [Candidatus Brocadiia bacterium]|jgi:prepilin-type N-terminal cleavage/methylation domain-containing protein